jgi:DNA-directed RNA polymerase subunit M/transcription elongation factor TFIIS
VDWTGTDYTLPVPDPCSPFIGHLPGHDSSGTTTQLHQLSFQDSRLDSAPDHFDDLLDDFFSDAMPAPFSDVGGQASPVAQDIHPPSVQGMHLSQSPPPSSRTSQVLPPAERRYKCSQCSASHVEQRQLRNHKRNEHKRLACTAPGCRSTYRHPKSLWQHQREEHQRIRFACDRCPYESGREWNLKRHKENKHQYRNGA